MTIRCAFGVVAVVVLIGPTVAAVLVCWALDKLGWRWGWHAAGLCMEPLIRAGRAALMA